MAKLITISIIILLIYIYPLYSLTEKECDSLYNFSITSIHNKKYRVAEIKLESILLNPDYSKIKLVYKKLGEVYLILRRVNKLYNLAKFATETYPQDSYGFAGLSAAYALKAEKSTKFTWKLRHANSALKNADIAISLNKNCSLAYFIRGLINYYMPTFFGRTNRAIENFLNVIKVKDNKKKKFLLETYYFLAKSYRKIRKNNMAVSTLKKALKLFPNNYPLKKLLKSYEKNR